MDIIFDIDGTLADASHRLHFIKDSAHWKSRNGNPPSPDWESFLASDLVAQDTPILPIWTLMRALYQAGHTILFITGRRDSERQMTEEWLERGHSCFLSQVPFDLYMRKNGDRRPSEIVKRESLLLAREDGYTPVLVFEDRDTDTAMWRSEGLICCQVADGNY